MSIEVGETIYPTITFIGFVKGLDVSRPRFRVERESGRVDFLFMSKCEIKLSKSLFPHCIEELKKGLKIEKR